jgi:nitroreductase
VAIPEIYTRRTIRSYLDQSIDNNILKRVAEAALFAPTATNRQPFSIIQLNNGDLDLLKNESEVVYNQMRERAELSDNKKIAKQLRFYWRFSMPVFKAPVVWLILKEKPDERSLAFSKFCSEHNSSGADVPGWLSIGCVVENLVLAAESEGLGSGIYTAPLIFRPDDVFAKILIDSGLTQEKFEPALFVTLGYSEKEQIKPSGKSLDDVYIMR